MHGSFCRVALSVVAFSAFFKEKIRVLVETAGWLVQQSRQGTMVASDFAAVPDLYCRALQLRFTRACLCLVVPQPHSVCMHAAV
jgi:hypothetical protein